MLKGGGGLTQLLVLKYLILFSDHNNLIYITRFRNVVDCFPRRQNRQTAFGTRILVNRRRYPVERITRRHTGELPYRCR